MHRDLADIGLIDRRDDTHLPEVGGYGEENGGLKGRRHGLARVDVPGDHDPVDRRMDDRVVEVRSGYRARGFLGCQVRFRRRGALHGKARSGTRIIEILVGQRPSRVKLVEPGVVVRSMVAVDLRLFQGCARAGQSRQHLSLLGHERLSVEACKHLTGLDAIVVVNLDRRHATADLRANLDGGDGLDVTGGPDLAHHLAQRRRVEAEACSERHWTRPYNDPHDEERHDCQSSRDGPKETPTAPPLRLGVDQVSQTSRLSRQNSTLREDHGHAAESVQRRCHPGGRPSWWYLHCRRVQKLPMYAVRAP